MLRREAESNFTDGTGLGEAKVNIYPGLNDFHRLWNRNMLVYLPAPSQEWMDLHFY